MSTYKARKNAAANSKFSTLKFLTTSALTATGLLASGHSVVHAQTIADDTTPGFEITKGQGTVDTSTAGLEVINQNSHILEAQAPKINLGSDATLRILGQAKNDIFAGRATSRTGLSQLFGTVEANGIVVFTDPSGFIVGKSFVADVNSLILGTGELSIDELTEGDRFTFFNSDAGAKIEIHEGATINIAEAGLASFVAPTVKNAGTINARLGRVEFAAGETVTVDLYGDGLFEVEVDGELADAYLENTGTINAQGGVVKMTALAAKDVADNIINLDGVTDVSSVTQVGGKIILSGGYKGVVSVKGKADASGKDGGEVEVTGETVVAEAGAEIDASGEEKGGNIRFGGAWQGQGDTPTSKFAFVDQKAILRNNAGEGFAGGETVVWSDLATFFYGSIEAEGGRVETSGKEYLLANGSVTADEWLLDPRNLEITNFNDDIVATPFASNPRIFVAVDDDFFDFNTSQINAATIEASLNNGSSVTLRTGNQDNGQGDIFVNAEITKVSGDEATLRLEAHDDIFVNEGIESTQGALNVELIAGALGNRFGDHDVQIDADIETNGGNVFASGHNIELEAGADIITSSGDVEFQALEDIKIDDDITTAGGKATFIAGDDFEVDNSADVVSTAGGLITVEANTFDLDGELDAGTGKVALSRRGVGQIDIGDSNFARFRIDQNELNRITASELTIGNQTNNFDNVLRIDNADFSRFAQTTLNTRNNDFSTAQDALFQGTNKAQALTVNADDDIRIATNASLETTGNVLFNTDTNEAGVGSFTMGTDATLDTNGNDFTVNTINVGLGENAKITAEGGNIDFNNTGVFASTSANSVSTNDEGTIQINQNGGTAAGASIQNAIDAIDNTGTGQNTLFTDGSTYVENLTINQENLKIDGLNTLIQGVITVNESNFNLDPVIVDAAGADYGLVASGLGALGLVIDGNTFRNSAKAGIFIAADALSTGTIKNNIFEGSATRGVQTGTIRNGYTLNITDNNIGFFGAEVVNGLAFGRVQDANINITRGIINSSGDAITFNSGTRGSSVVNLTDVIAFSGDEGLDVNGRIRGNSIFNVNRGTFIGAGNGLEFSRIDGTVTLTDVASSSTARRGLNLLGAINGNLNINGGVYTGIVDGIGTNNNQGVINNGKVEITNTIVSATDGDGIEFAGINADGILNIKGTTISARNDGISLGLVGGTANIGDAMQNPDAPKSTTIIADGNGITSDLTLGPILGGVVNVKNVDIEAGLDGIALKSIDKSVISNNIITAGNDGINVNTFGTTDISFNDIDNTGDDGIDVSFGNKVDIYNNFIDLAGFLPNGFLNIEVGQNRADGIKVSDIRAPIIEDEPDFEAFAAIETDAGSETETDTFEALVNIENNEIANVSDDGIDVQNSDSAFINNNTIGHVGDDGIDLDDVDVAMLRINKITLAEDNGITVTGGEYAGIFENRILLAGDNGIRVRDVNGGQDTEVTGDVVYGEGWSVNIGGNQIALVGDDGIEVSRTFGEGGVGVTGPTNIVGNQIFGAGLGDALAPVIGVVNALASRSFEIGPRTAAIRTAEILDAPEEDIPESFGFNWGDGNGINVTGVTGAVNSPNGFAVNIEGNTVKYTGGNGIQVIGADRARISGINNVSYAGLDFTSFSGVESMGDLLRSGPLSRENAGRRDLWETEGSMFDVIDGYIGNESEQPAEPEYGQYVTLTDIEFGNSDGIYVEDVYSDSAEPNATALEIDDNIISFVGDDGIEVDSAGRTIISGNTISDAGFGDNEYYGAGDESGADGIHVENVSTSFTREIGGINGIGRVSSEEPVVTPIEELPVHERPFNFEADSEYALIIRGNTIERTGDDGVEVVGSGENYGNTKFGAIGIGGRDYEGDEGENPRPSARIFGITDRTLVTGNTISETGFEFAETDGDAVSSLPTNVGQDGRGHDGIHVRNVTGTQIFGIISDDKGEQNVARQAEGYSGGLSTSPQGNGNFYGYAVDIVKNEVQRTGDDGIEVDNAQSTLITLNTVSQAGVRDVEKDKSTDSETSFDRFGLNTDGADFSGADGIRVRNIGGTGAQLDWIGAGSGDGFEAYSVAIVTNDVSKTADEGIEVVGESSNNQMGDIFDIRVSYDDDDESFQYNGTGRILIEGNTIADAGTSGQIIDESTRSSNGISSVISENRTGFAGSFDGRGGDGIHVNLAPSNNDDIIIWPVPTAMASASASGLSTGGDYDSYEQPYDVQVIGNTIERTGDDGIEILGDDNNRRLPMGKFGASGLMASSQYGGLRPQQPSINRVLVEGNTISDSGVNARTFNSERSRTETVDTPDSEFEVAIAISNETSTRTTSEGTFGNAGQDGRGADAIHVSGVGQTDNERVFVGAVGTGEEAGIYQGYAVDVIDNIIDGTADDGIEVTNSSSTYIALNNVKNAGALTTSSSTDSTQEIETFGTLSTTRVIFDVDTGAEFSKFESETGADGISVSNVGTLRQGVSAVRTLSGGMSFPEGDFEEYAVVVFDNTVDNSSDDGIEVANAGRTRIEINDVTNSGVATFTQGERNIEEGPISIRTSIRTSQGTRDFDGQGNDGIHVRNVQTTNVEFVEIPDDESPESEVESQFDFEGPSGFFQIADENSVEIIGNTVDNSSDDGIQVLSSGDTLIGGLEELEANTVTNSGIASEFEGEFVEGQELFSETGFIDETGGDGINVDTSGGFLLSESEDGSEIDVNIIGNQVSNSADDGIEVSNTGENEFFDDGEFSVNSFRGFGFNGTTNVTVDANDIIDSGDNGIALVTSNAVPTDGEESEMSSVFFFGPADMNSTVTGNTSENSGNNGLIAQGAQHNDVIVADNTFTNNPTGARFESGEVDLTGGSNTFTVTPDFVAPEGFDFITGLQLDIQEAGTPVAELSLVGNTLGETIFSGFGPTTRLEGESFYVRIEDDAILDGAGVPIEIDGTLASFDGLIPNEQSNILTLDELLDIENFLFDADDIPFDGRGQIFVGNVPDLNEEDFIRELALTQFGTSGARVLVQGLPAFDGVSLANIETQAGGDDENGNSDEDLSDIEPAAGGNDNEEAACWGDAINAASETGSAVSFSFGGSFEDSIAKASACESAQ